MIDIETINTIYEKNGFHSVLLTINDVLKYGQVIQVGAGLWKITTGGWSDDEQQVDELNSFISFFRDKHYIGYLRGGAYYYAEDPNKIDDAKIVLF